MIRLLAVTHFYEAHGGGIERVAGHLNRQLTALGHQLTWAASDEDALPDLATAAPAPLRCAGVIERLTSMPMPLPGLAALRRLARAIGQCDHVLIHDSLYLTSIAAMLFARLSRRPVTLVQHIARIPFASPAMRVAMRWADAVVTAPMLRSADQVVFISATSRDAFRHLSLKRPPVLLFNGVDHDVFRPGDPAERDDTRRSLGIAPTDRVVLFVGRLVRKKGLDTVREIARMRPDLQVILAGRGPIDPDSWALPNVRVVRDRSGPSLAALYRAADVLVLPSFGEGYPLVVQEALACGLRVLCDAGSARADPGAACWLTGIDVDPADPARTAAAFVAGIDAAAAAPDERAGMAHYARETYCWSRMAQAVSSLCQPTLRTRQPAAAAAARNPAV